MTASRAPRRPGKVRPAGLTDLAALGELSRLCQSDGADTRSLGLPVNGPPIGVFSLFRLPLGAFRPNDLMFVYEEEDTRQVAERARERWQARGGGDGNADDDWFAAERDLLQVPGAATPVRYRLIKKPYSPEQ